MPRLANDCLSQVERGALEEQLRCDNCVLVKTEGWGQWYLKPHIRKENGVECTGPHRHAEPACGACARTPATTSLAHGGACLFYIGLLPVALEPREP